VAGRACALGTAPHRAEALLIAASCSRGANSLDDISTMDGPGNNKTGVTGHGRFSAHGPGNQFIVFSCQ